MGLAIQIFIQKYREKSQKTPFHYVMHGIDNAISMSKLKTGL